MIAIRERSVKIDRSTPRLGMLDGAYKFRRTTTESAPWEPQHPSRSNVKLERSLVKEETFCPKPKLIMLFSNTKDLRRIIQLSLEEIAGWQVLVAELDAQDLTLVTVMQPDAILLDTNLPISDEWGILQKIQDYPEIQKIPRVLLTERIFNSDRRIYHSLGIVAAIAKPCDMVTLATLISQRLNWDWHRQ